MDSDTEEQTNFNSNLTSLMQANHNQKVDQTKMTVCVYCDKHFSCKSTLGRHIQNVHGIASIRASMKCLTCEKKFALRKRLIEHLRKDHGQVIEENVVVFKTSEEFEVWRYEEERRSGAMYRNFIIDRPSKNGTTSILLCCRDGKYQPYLRNRVRKLKGTRKIGHVCTSHIIVYKIIEPESKVIVRYVKTHYGHDVMEGTLVKGRKCNQKIFKNVVEHRIKNLNGPETMMAQEDECEAANKKLRQVYLVIKKDKDVFLQPIDQCVECKVCRQSLTGSSIISFPGYSICKHGNFFATQNLDQSSLLHDSTNGDSAAADTLKEIQKNNHQTKFSLEYEFRKLLGKLQHFQEKFHLLPDSNQIEILRHMRISNSLLNEDNDGTYFQENQPVRKVNGCKRKTSKKDDLGKMARVNKTKRLKRTTKMSPESTIPLTNVEVQINEYALWNDHGISVVSSIDHEEVVF